jgi:hypothetical protein
MRSAAGSRNGSRRAPTKSGGHARGRREGEESYTGRYLKPVLARKPKAAAE